MTATRAASELANVDLDAVAAHIRSRIETWTRAGLIVSALTWRDARASWPQPLPTDRAKVIEPESLGVVVSAPDARNVELVVWRGGWTDGFLNTTADSVPLTADVTDFTDVASCLRVIDESVALLTGWRTATTDLGVVSARTLLLGRRVSSVQCDGAWFEVRFDGPVLRVLGAAWGRIDGRNWRSIDADSETRLQEYVGAAVTAFGLTEQRSLAVVLTDGSLIVPLGEPTEHGPEAVHLVDLSDPDVLRPLWMW